MKRSNTQRKTAGSAARPVVSLRVNDGGKSAARVPLAVFTINRLLDLATGVLPPPLHVA